MCGLKLRFLLRFPVFPVSHPAWVCGLKPSVVLESNQRISHTLRGCVDWNTGITGINCGKCRHTLRGCVDWNSIIDNVTVFCSCHTLRGCVDWNILREYGYLVTWSHPAWVCGLKLCIKSINSRNRGHTLRGCVDWNMLNRFFKYILIIVTPCVGVWIETSPTSPIPIVNVVTPCVGVWIETIHDRKELSMTCHTLRGCVDWNIAQQL